MKLGKVMGDLMKFMKDLFAVVTVIVFLSIAIVIILFGILKLFTSVIS